MVSNPFSLFEWILTLVYRPRLYSPKNEAQWSKVGTLAPEFDHCRYREIYSELLRHIMVNVMLLKSLDLEKAN